MTEHDPQAEPTQGSHPRDEGRPEPAASVGLRERKKQRRRQALHEAALHLIETQGLDGSTVEDICEVVGVSPRTFFNYFPSKAAAALNLPDHVVSPEAAAAFRSARGELVPALCQLIAASMHTGVERKRLQELVARQPDLMPAFSQWLATVKDEFMHLARERARTDEDATAAVALTLSALSVLVHDTSPGGHPAYDRLQEAVDRIVAVRQAQLAEA